MIDKLLVASQHIVLKVILGFTVFACVLTGIDSFTIDVDNNCIVKINGQQISRAQLEQAVQIMHNSQQVSNKEKSSQLFLPYNEQHMRQQVLFSLINEVLLDQYAATLGLVISDNQIKQAILSIPAFYTNSKFDEKRFRKIINNMGLTPDQYALLMRKQLLVQQLLQGIGNSSFLLPIEANYLLEIAMQIREARISTFDISTLSTKQNASDNEINAKYNIDKNQYMSSEMFQVNYIQMNAALMQEQANIDKQEILTWYDQHLDQFTVPASKRYSVIQTKTEAEAQELLLLLQQGYDFVTLAKAKSRDVISVQNGGDIGWVNDVDTIDELKQANLINKKQLSSIIKSSLGFLIFRLDDIQLEKVETLDTVYDQIIAKLKKEKAIDAYYSLQQKVRNAVISNNKTLAFAENISGIKVHQTGWFSRDEVPVELDFDEIKRVLFDGSLLSNDSLLGKNSDIITIDNNRSFIISIVNYKPASIKPLTEVREQIKQEIKRKKALEQARIDAQKALNELLEHGKVDYLSFSALQKFSSVDQHDPLSQAIFALPHPHQGKTSYGIASDDNKGNIVLVALDKVIPIQLDMQQRQKLTNQLHHDMTEIVFDVLLDNLRNQAKITMYNNTI